jgi:hypothetical protein
MRKALALLAALFLITAPAARAQMPGLDLGWGNCLGDGGASLRAFACTTTSGQETIVASWVPAADVPAFSGAEIFVNLYTAGSTLPAFWSIACAGSNGPFSADLTYPATAVNCMDAWAGLGVGGIAAYNIGTFGPASAQLDIAAGLPMGSEQSLAAGLEYQLFNIRVTRFRASGVNACTGCVVPACFRLQELRYVQPAGPEVRVTRMGEQNTLYWQNAYIAPCLPIPVRNQTWGAIKSLYR